MQNLKNMKKIAEIQSNSEITLAQEIKILIRALRKTDQKLKFIPIFQEMQVEIQYLHERNMSIQAG